MTPAEFREIRAGQGLSAQALARLMGVGSGRTIRRWEAGERPIPGMAEKLMLMLRERGPGALSPL